MDDMDDDKDEGPAPIVKGMIVRPVVFFSDWLGVVLTNPKQYVPTADEEDMMIYAPGVAPYAGYQWAGVDVVEVYWFGGAERTEEFVDFLEIVSPPQDELDDPDYFLKKHHFDWTDEPE